MTNVKWKMSTKGDSNAIDPQILGGCSYVSFDCWNGPCFSRSADRTDNDPQRGGRTTIRLNTCLCRARRRGPLRCKCPGNFRRHYLQTGRGNRDTNFQQYHLAVDIDAGGYDL